MGPNTLPLRRLAMVTVSDYPAPTSPRETSIFDAATTATFLQIGWLIAIPLSVVALWASRHHARAHRAPLVVIAVLALAIRLLAANFDLGAERLPYLTQATCIAHAEARVDYTLCGVRLFGDVHQLGTASLFALGFRSVASDKWVASTMVLWLSVLNALLLYAVAWMAYRRRDVAVGAALLLALHPLAVHFAGATQTETLNDTMLLLGVLLVLWDARRSGAAVDRSPGAATRIAASPLFRAFFVAMAANVRLELMVLLPILAWSALRFTRPARVARLHVALLAGLSGVLLLSAVTAVRHKSHGFTSAEHQLQRLWEHLVDSQWNLGSAWVTLILLVALALAVRRRRQLTQTSRALLTLTLGINGMYAVVPGLYLHVMPHQVHLVYHGSVLLWPIYSYAVFLGCEWLASHRTWLPSSRVMPAMILAASLVPMWMGSPVGLRSGVVFGLNGGARAVVSTLPERSLVVFLHPQLFASAAMAPLLFADGTDFVVFEPTGYAGERSDEQICGPLRNAAMEAQGRPITLIADPSTEEVEFCGLRLGPTREVGGYRVGSLALP